MHLPRPVGAQAPWRPLTTTHLRSTGRAAVMSATHLDICWHAYTMALPWPNTVDRHSLFILCTEDIVPFSGVR